jgi:folate-binding protein YgfZ
MTKRTPLYERETVVGAKFELRATRRPDGQEDLWEIASLYSTVEEEYAAVRHAAGLLDFSHRGKIRIKGPDSLKYLHGQVTNDIKRLPLHGSCYAFVLTHKGAIVGDVNVHRTGIDELLIDTSEYCALEVFDHLLRFAISDDVEIEDITESTSHLGLHGPKAMWLLYELTREADAHGWMHPHSIEGYPIGPNNVLVHRQGSPRETGWTGEMGFDFFLEEQDPGLLWTTLLEKGEQYGLKCVGSRSFDILRLEAGVPLYGVDMTEEHLALEVLPTEEDVRRTISTDKGCYIGQEVVARIINRGHVNRILAGLAWEGADESREGRKLFKGDQAVGELTSSHWSPSLKKVVALGYVPSLQKDPGNRFSVGGPNSRIIAEVVQIPFYKPPIPSEEELAKLIATTHAN